MKKPNVLKRYFQRDLDLCLESLNKDEIKRFKKIKNLTVDYQTLINDPTIIEIFSHLKRIDIKNCENEFPKSLSKILADKQNWYKEDYESIEKAIDEIKDELPELTKKLKNLHNYLSTKTITESFKIENILLSPKIYLYFKEKKGLKKELYRNLQSRLFNTTYSDYRYGKMPSWVEIIYLNDEYCYLDHDFYRFVFKIRKE